MMLQAVLVQPKALLEDEDEDEDGQRNKVKMSSEMKKMNKKMEDEEDGEGDDDDDEEDGEGDDDDDMDDLEGDDDWYAIKPVVGDEEDVISNFTKVYWDFDSARRQLEDQSMNACFASEPSITRNIKDIIDFKLSVDQPKIIRLEALLEDEDLEDEDEQRNKWRKYGQKRIFDTGASVCTTGDLSITDSSLQNRAHRISSADASGRLRPEVDTGFCSPLWVLDSGGAPPPWIYDTGASFTLTEDLCIPLPPRHRPRGLAQHNLHRPRGLAQHNLHRPRPRALAQHNLQRPPWLPRYRALAQHNLQRPRPRALAQHNLHRPCALAQHNLQRPRPRALAQHNLHRPRGLAQHNLHRPRGLAQHNLHRHRPRGLAQLLRVLSPVWIYDTGASFSLTGDLSLLPGVCSTGDCSPFLGLRHADPVSAANGQSVVSNKCGRASGTLNLSRTAPQTTGLISSSEPIAADNSSLLTPDTTPEQTWRVASAAPQHMTGYLNHLIDYTPASGDQVIDTPNMGPLAVHGRGSVNTANITLQDVLYVPCLDANLVSTGQLAQLGYMITLGPYGCRIYKDDEDMPLVGEAHYVDGYLLELDFLRVRPSTN